MPHTVHEASRLARPEKRCAFWLGKMQAAFEVPHLLESPELLKLVLAVGKAAFRFPSVIFWTITSPPDKELSVLASGSHIKDLSNIILHIPVMNNVHGGG